MHDVERTANLLGAAALVVADLTLAGITSGSGVSASGAAALVVLRAGSPLSVTELGRRVGLTQSAAARMVDGLQARGLLRREPGGGRVVHVRLTEAGARAAEETARIRGELLRDALGELDPAQLEGLESALGTLLARLYRTVADADLMCRLCDRDCCTRHAACPVGAAERQAQGQAERQVDRRVEGQAERQARRRAGPRVGR